MNNLKNDCEEWLITGEEELSYPPENVFIKKNNTEKNVSNNLSRKKRLELSKEKKFMEIIDNTIILAPDWFYNKRRKIIMFGLQLDLESIIIGIFIGIICTDIKLIYTLTLTVTLILCFLNCLGIPL